MLVDIWSDIVCPWCAIGKVRFERALAQFAHRDDVVVRWRSFQLDPSAPTERSGDYVAHLAGKYGTSREQAQAMIDRMTDTAAQEGLDFRFDLARPGNTVDAHRLLHLAADHGLQHALKDRLLHATFTEGLPIGDPATLQLLAVEVGLDEVAVKEVLAGDAYADTVRADLAQAHEYGISGVPFFVLDGAIGVSGAQPTEVLLQALQQAWDRQSGLQMVDGRPDAAPVDADACGPDGCAVDAAEAD